MIHLGKGEIADYLAGRLEVTGRHRVVRHLLGGCEICKRRFKALASPLLTEEEPWSAAEPVAEAHYDEVLDGFGVAARTLLRRWRKENAKLDRALVLLNQFPRGLADREFPLRQAQALHGWPLCEALLRKSYEARFSEPKRMLNLAESAAAVAESLRLEKYPWPGFVADLRARAFAEAANAYRINDRFSEADVAFAKARECLEDGTGDPAIHARVLDLLASLRTNQRRLDEAVTLLDQAHTLYLEAGDSHLAGRALISKGNNLRYQGSPRDALVLLESGLSLLQQDRDPELVSVGQQAIIDALADCGEYRQASRLLFQSGLREAFADAPLNLLKLRWVEGKIHDGLGRQARAERAFAEVRKEFLERGQVYDASLVGLELAAVWLRQGRAAEVHALAEEMYETFEDLGVPWEGGKALYFVREACRQQAITVTMIERIQSFVERLGWNPWLRFVPAEFAP